MTESVTSAASLPLEDTLWLITINHLKDDSGAIQPYLVILDGEKRNIGTSKLKDPDISFTQQCHDLVHSCCLNPQTGKPRRPRACTIIDQSLSKQAIELDLSDLGIQHLSDSNQYTACQGPVRMRECCVCRKRGTRDLFITCLGCKAMRYCSDECQRTDWSRDGAMSEHSHKHWCDTLKLYMAEAEELNKLPFTFTSETTSEDFDQMAYQQFLKRQGIHNQGFWIREVTSTSPNNLSNTPFGDLCEEEDGVVLPVECCILDQAPDGAAVGPIESWAAYYSYRGLRLDSPVAILLQWPLTLYHVIANCLPLDYPDHVAVKTGGTLCVDIVGVEREVELLPLFMEVGYLLPTYSLDICMYGPGVSKTVNNKHWQKENVQIRVTRGLYHKKSDTSRSPHLILGYNAGIGAYPSWIKTLQKLKTEKITAYFTDYCQFSCQYARKAITQIGLGTAYETRINPFRSPIRKVTEENNMPSYSNGFLYNIRYPP